MSKSNNLNNIVRLVKKGDKENAASQLYKRCSSNTIGYLKSKGLGNHEAQEVFHETILTVIEKIENDKIAYLKKSYIIKVANFKSNNYNKKKITLLKKEKFNLEENLESLLSSASIEKTEISFREKLARKAYESLDEKCQKILKYKVLLDYTHDEVVEQMDTINTNDSSRVTLQNCKKKFIRIFKELE